MAMEAYFKDDLVTIYQGNCLEVMKTFPENSIDTILTDPPYGLKFMGKDWDHGVPGVPYWAEALRVAKPGAFLLAFGGTRTYHRLACAIEDAGWEIRDCINWLYGSGFPKSHDISKAIDKAAGVKREVVGQKLSPDGKPMINRRPNNFQGEHEGWDHPWKKDRAKVELQASITAPATEAAQTWHGWGTALKPAWEPIIVAMKPLDGTFAENALKHGVAGLNVDGCRVQLEGDYKCGANGRPSQTGLGDNYDPGKANQHSEQGRWPANVIHDGSEEVVGLFPVTTSGAIKPNHNSRGLGSSKHEGYQRPCKEHYKNIGWNIPKSTGSAARFFYTAKAAPGERGKDNNHPTVKPEDLMKYLCKLTATPAGGVILDPFMGSGTTLKAARVMGRKSIGIDIEEDSCRIAVKRLKQGVLNFGE